MSNPNTYLRPDLVRINLLFGLAEVRVTVVTRLEAIERVSYVIG